jgi:hypothetical protein
MPPLLDLLMSCSAWLWLHRSTPASELQILGEADVARSVGGFTSSSAASKHLNGICQISIEIRSNRVSCELGSDSRKSRQLLPMVANTNHGNGPANMLARASIKHLGR